jgi:dolichol-phosphate mannosyltransferase
MADQLTEIAIKPVNISVAIPLLNEVSGLDELLRRVFSVLDRIEGSHQVVIVDGTLEKLRQATIHESRLQVVALSRNFGHQVAISAALDYSIGDVVVVMDGDLQDDPEVIPLFLAEYRAGYDVVYAIRHKRKENLFKRACYKAFYRLFAMMVDFNIPVDSGDFGLMSRRIVELLKQSNERQRFLRGLRTWYGFEQKGLMVERSMRSSGRPKYTFFKLLRLASDGIFSFSIVPIRAAMVTGTLAMFCSMLYAMYAIYVRLFRPEFEQAPAGFTAIILSIVFLSGIQLLFVGIIGEYVGRIYEEVKQRPLYVVKQIFGTKHEQR